MNNPVPVGETRFFALSSRIGRLRYLAYGLGLTLLAIVPFCAGAGLAALVPPLGWLLIVATYIGLLFYSVVFAVRRLHDQDLSGWWALLMIVPIGNLVLLVMLLFLPGTQGDNRFGPPPAPNNNWVIAGAVVYIALIPITIIGILAAIAIPAYADYIGRAQTSEAIQLAGGAETGLAEYYANNNRAWPQDLGTVYDAAKQNPAGRYVATVSGSSPGADVYLVVATMKDSGVSDKVAGKSVELWTTDGGQTWHCGPGGPNPLSPMMLPMSCRESDAP